jgi:hypothetical protein
MWRPGADIQVPRLQPKDLYDRRARRDYARLKAYNTLLEQIYNRVYTTSQLSGNTSSVLYTVPPFILGLPKLDMEDCIVYLVWQLRQAGFEVRFTWPNFLLISWRHTEGDYLAHKNPIVQAMMPEPPPKPTVTKLGQPTGGGASGTGGKKKAAPTPVPPSSAKPTVAFNEAVELITGSQFGSQPLQAPPRSAAEYQPPQSFVQNLERPGPGRETGRGDQKAKTDIMADLWGGL